MDKSILGKMKSGDKLIGLVTENADLTITPSYYKGEHLFLEERRFMVEHRVFVHTSYINRAYAESLLENEEIAWAFIPKERSVL